MYPTISDYNTEIFKFGNGVFATLRDYQFVPSRTVPVTIFSYGNGSYAVVFKAAHINKNYAIRCFISANADVFWRYSRIDAYLKGLNESWVTKFDFIDDEFKIKGYLFPIVKMEWIEGELLNKYISNHLYDNNALDKLQKAFVALSESLERNKISHGDIQCGNVVIQGGVDPVIRLIDYDGMYIPEFQSLPCLERGRSEFQHPQRPQMIFDEKIDRFSFWVIITALEALKCDKNLWLESTKGGYNTLDNTLFVGSDFRSFNQSPLVNKLYSLNEDGLNFYLNKLNGFCLGAGLMIDKPSLFEGGPVTSGLKEDNLPKPIVAKPGLGNITINSFPIGAKVLTEDHVKIGQTPVILNKDTILNKRIILSYGTKFQLFQITSDTTDIFYQFAEPELINSFQPTILGPEDQETDYTILANTHYVPNPNAKSNVPVFIWIGLILILGIVISYYVSINKTRQTSYITETTSNNDMPIDTAVVSSINDAPLATTATPTEAVTSYFDLIDDVGYSPESLLRGFFYDLGNQRFQDAFNKTYVTSWEKNGYDWFASGLEYGGISDINLTSVIKNEESTDKVSFVVYFSRNHIYDGLLCYSQIITLTHNNFIADKNIWMITSVVNTTEPSSCQ